MSVKRVILALSPSPWFGAWMNRQQLLSRLSEYPYEIFYSTGMWSVWDRDSPEWKSSPAFGTFKKDHGVYIDLSPKWLMYIPKLPFLDSLVRSIGFWRLQRRMGLSNVNEFILHIFHPKYQEYAKHFKSKSISTYLVYHPYDLYESTPGWSHELEVKEDWLLKNAELRITCSNSLARRLEERASKKVHVVPNGADVNSFQAALKKNDKPDDIASIPHPRIGYAGRINRKVDLKLIYDLANLRPDWNFIFVGPIFSLDEETSHAISQFKSMKNIFILGEKNRDVFPDYVASLDVGLMPYRTDAAKWTSVAVPLKLNEYLAAELPVVSVPLCDVSGFSDVVFFAEKVEEWAASISKALAEGASKKKVRLKVALENDWSCRVDDLNTLLQLQSTDKQLV